MKYFAFSTSTRIIYKNGFVFIVIYWLLYISLFCWSVPELIDTNLPVCLFCFGKFNLVSFEGESYNIGFHTLFQSTVTILYLQAQNQTFSAYKKYTFHHSKIYFNKYMMKHTKKLFFTKHPCKNGVGGASYVGMHVIREQIQYIRKQNKEQWILSHWNTLRPTILIPVNGRSFEMDYDQEDKIFHLFHCGFGTIPCNKYSI